ncbi:MAG: hypothetical protein K6E63_08340 [Lachnospiraceae bacterium]|nr:hypothetical protein [Lachnospiraceae bacterium]
MKNLTLIIILTLPLLIQGCKGIGTPGSVDPGAEAVNSVAATSDTETVIEVADTEANSEDMSAADPTTPADDSAASSLIPEIIVDGRSYEYKWGDLSGHKFADTTGTATLILDKDGDLYYFGTESPEPVVIMKDVKAFSLDDNSDTLGYTAPVAVILTDSGDLYACGDSEFGVISDVSVLADVEDNTGIPFLKPVLINKNVKECCITYRQIAYITGDDELYRSTYVSDILGEEMENPTKVSEMESISQYFTEGINENHVLSGTVQMGCGRNLFVSVLEDGSVWSCFLPKDEEDVNYAKGYGIVLGDGAEELAEAAPVCVMPPGTCF